MSNFIAPLSERSSSSKYSVNMYPEVEQAVYDGSQDVRLCYRNLGAVPPFVMDKDDTKLLDLSNNKLTILPNMLVWRAEATLRSLFINSNLLVALPAEICRCQTLQDLRVSNNQLASLPAALGTLDTLTRLDLQGNRLITLPDSLSSLVDLRVLNVSRNLIRELNENHMAALTAMTDLNLDANRLSTLPLSLVYQRQLRSLRASANRIALIEVDVVTLPSLEELHVADNLLQSMPAHCWNRGQSTRLVALDLSGNEITDVPTQMALLKRLRVFGLARNPNLPLPLLEASYSGAEAAIKYLEKQHIRNQEMHAKSRNNTEDEDIGDSIMRLNEQRAKEKQERLARMHKLLATNNTGVTSFYKAVASMTNEGIPDQEIQECKNKLANRMLNEFQHEGFSKKEKKKQDEGLRSTGRVSAGASPLQAASPLQSHARNASPLGRAGKTILNNNTLHKISE